MTKIIFRTIFSLLLAVSLAAASKSRASEPAQSERDQLTRRVDALFAAWDKTGSPGCALGVIKDGELIYSRGYGMANLEYGIAITPKSVFDIGSTSKQFTAASVVLLSQQGMLSLEDDIHKFIPELPDYSKRITVRNLLNHTSGIRDYLGLMLMRGMNFDDTTGDDDALRLIVRQKGLNFDPGSEYLYSNSGYFLLSIIVKRVSGKTLAQFAAENIFRPLGMEHTHYHDNHTVIVPMRATGYSPSDGGFKIEMSNFEQTGDGAVYTTVEDLLLWDRNFYDPKVGGRRMYDEMLTQGILTSGKKINYAEGLMVDGYKGLKTIHHGGSWAGYRAELIRFPDQHFSVICLSNLASFNPSKLARDVAGIYLADVLKAPSEAAKPTSSPTTVAISEKELKERAGAYREAKTGLVIKVIPMPDRLMIDYAGMLRFQAVPVSKTSFHGVDAPADIKIDFDGPAKLVLKVETGEPSILERVEVEKLTPAQLAEYAGEYYSDELDVTYALEAKDYKLSFRIAQRGENLVLEPGIKDVFSVRGNETHFFRNHQDRVTGFELNAGRVKGIKFVRK